MPSQAISFYELNDAMLLFNQKFGFGLLCVESDTLPNKTLLSELVMLEVTVYEMRNENTRDETMTKTIKLPTQLRFITTLYAIFASRAAQYQKLVRNVPHLQVHCYVYQRVKSRDRNERSVRTTKHQITQYFRKKTRCTV
jgi:hypothetical protein